MPKKPSAPIRLSTSRGTKPASSQASAYGLISSSTKRRTWSRSISCSGEKKGELRSSPTAEWTFMKLASSGPEALAAVPTEGKKGCFT